MNFTRLRNAMYAGGAFVALAAFTFVLPFLNLSFLPLVRQLWLIALIRFVLFCFLLVHLEGYVQLAKRFDSKILLYSSRVIMLLLVPFVLSALYPIVFIDSSAFNPGEIDGISIVLLTMASLSFAYGVYTIFKNLGPLSISSAFLVPAYVYFFWQLWPALIVMGVSTYLLWQKWQGQTQTTA